VPQLYLTSRAYKEAEEIRVLRILCTLEKVCHWGGDSRDCCLSCHQLKSCNFICDQAEREIINGEKCRYKQVVVQ
jgi:hypothetical protein